MISRIPQRTQDDCAICVTAMVMGPPYSYERVSRESSKYPKIAFDGTFPAWWETYLSDEGFDARYWPFDVLRILSNYHGNVLGMLGLDIPHLKAGHIVAVDEIGVVDPADNAPDHIPLMEYIMNRSNGGAVFHDEWLAIRKPSAISRAPRI
jgi:hypothetical protein